MVPDKFKIVVANGLDENATVEVTGKAVSEDGDGTVTWSSELTLFSSATVNAGVTTASSEYDASSGNYRLMLVKVKVTPASAPSSGQVSVYLDYPTNTEYSSSLAGFDAAEDLPRLKVIGYDSTNAKGGPAVINL